MGVRCIMAVIQWRNSAPKNSEVRDVLRVQGSTSEREPSVNLLAGPSVVGPLSRSAARTRYEPNCASEPN